MAVVSTKERLAAALRAANAPAYMIDNAERGRYDDFESDLATPQLQLHADAQSEGLTEIAAAVERGEFDATKEESDAWAASETDPETRAMIDQLGLNAKPKGMRVRFNDDEFIDRIVIETIPRFKTSGLSGDEWRYHVQVTGYRKGLVIADRAVGTMKYAQAMLATGDWWTEHEAIPKPDVAEALCDQMGCDQPWTVLYRLKTRGCGRCGNRHVYAGDEAHPYLRAFCEKHKTRGDSDLDDMDELYEAIAS